MTFFCQTIELKWNKKTYYWNNFFWRAKIWSFFLYSIWKGPKAKVDVRSVPQNMSTVDCKWSDVCCLDFKTSPRCSMSAGISVKDKTHKVWKNKCIPFWKPRLVILNWDNWVSVRTNMLSPVRSLTMETYTQNIKAVTGFDQTLFFLICWHGN